MALPELPTNWLDPLFGKLLGLFRGQSAGVDLKDVNGDYPNVPILNAVAPLEMAYTKEQSRFDLSIAASALIPEVKTSRTAYVDVANGSDTTGTLGERTLPYQTVEAALLAAAIAAPSQANPVLVLVWPGTLAENPLVIPSWVTVASAGGPGATTLVAIEPASPLITVSPDSAVVGLTLLGANGAGGSGIAMSSPGDAIAQSCSVINCETAVLCTAGRLVAYFCNALKGGGIMDRGFVADGGEIDSIGCTAGGDGPSGLAGAAVLADNGGRFGGQALVRYCDEGIKTDSGGAVRVQGSLIEFCDVGVRMTPTGGPIEIASTAISGSVTADIVTENPTGQLVSAGLLHELPPVITPGVDWFGERYDRVARTAFSEGNYSAGAPGRPATSSFGGGGIHVTGLRAWHNNNVEAGTFTDVTDELTSATGSIVNLVPGLGVGSSLFVGSDQPLPGLYFDIALARVGGAITPKYWNGASWTAIPRWMTTEALPPYAPTANALFTATGKQDVRFATMPGDTPKVVGPLIGSVLKYWYLFEVTSALTTIPRVEQVRLHTSHAAHGPDGTLLYYGDARPVLPIEMGLSLWNAAVSSPSTATVNYSANVLQGGLRNFTNSVQRSVGYEYALAPQLDTSGLLTVRFVGYPTTGGAGNIDTILYYVPVPAGSTTVGALPGEVALPVSVAAPLTAGQEIVFSFSIPVAGLVAGVDTVAMTFTRLSTDAYSGDLIIRNIKGSARAWRS